jgi:ribose transport system ATP-binding protein
MDEPTSSLSAGEAENLFRVIQDLRARGVSIVYISHRLGEVTRLADRVVVLRDGENSGELARHEISHAAMVRLMVGRDLSQFYPHQPHARTETVLEVDGLRTPAHPTHPLTFQIRAGEMVGLAGLVGAGRTEVLLALFGVQPAVGGTLKIGGQLLRAQTPAQAIAAGLALVPEDRKREGLVLGMPVRENLSLASLRQDQRHGFRDTAREASLSAEMIQSLRIKTPSDRQVVQFLSGGNQQKAVIGKWLALKPKVLLLDELSMGLAPLVVEELYGIVAAIARSGTSILVVEQFARTVLGVADVAAIMVNGAVRRVGTPSQVEHELSTAYLGG